MKQKDYLNQQIKWDSNDWHGKGSERMKPENILLAAAGIIILALLAVILHMKYMYGIRLHNEEEKVRALKRNLQEQYDREIERIRSSLSHSFRMPLAIISGYSDILLKSEIIEKEKSQKYLEKICDNAKYLSVMVNHSLMQIQRNSSEPVCVLEPVNLVEIVRKTSQDIEELLSLNGITLKLQFDENVIMVYGDKIQLANVLNNLFDNAVKYMRRNGCITISVSRMGHRVLLTYKDNGEGMKTKETTKIFEERYQGSNGTHGSGNGLYIVKKIIDAHDGEIYADSHCNRGMRISIYIPTYPDNL